MSSDPLSVMLTGVNMAAEAARLYACVASNSQAGELQALVCRIKKPRKPKEGNFYSLSIFHPHVLASERLIAWTTPISAPFYHSLSSILPAADVLALLHIMLFSLDEKTCELYRAGPLCFTQYCNSRGIPEADCMPALEIILAGFSMAMAAGKVACMTLDNWLAGLHFWHTINGAPWYGKDMLRTVKGGVSKLVPDTSWRAKRPPVTIQHLYALRRGLDLSSFNAVVWALACVAFWSCCHLGELLIPSRHGFQALKHVS